MLMLQACQYRFRGLFSLLFGWFFLLSAAALAQAPDTAQLPLPRLEPCRQNSHPLLPQRWRGVYLMAPFTPTQLLLAEIVVDGTLPAMLVRLYGIRSGTAELFVFGKKTYLISVDGSQGQCEALAGTSWTPLPRDLLAEDASCVGAAPISETPVEWWKTPIQPRPLTDWVWFKSSDRSPFRLLFQKPSDRLSILSSHALSYQVAFESLLETNLETVAAVCTGSGTSTKQPMSLQKVLDAMQRSHATANSDIKRLFPELTSTCPAPTRPSWPEALGMTMILTPLKFKANPLPTEVQYSWKHRSQRTRMFWPSGSPIAHEDALMVAAHGYSVTHKRRGQIQCIPALPGTPRPTWIRDAPCTCEGFVEGVTHLTPYGSVEILRCPATPPRLFWTWHTLDGRPMIFMVTPSNPNEPTALITMADYYTWAPGLLLDEITFKRPVQCPDLAVRPQAKTPRPAAARLSEPCSRCHLAHDSPR
jgi:hypothetical protein